MVVCMAAYNRSDGFMATPVLRGPLLSIFPPAFCFLGWFICLPAVYHLSYMLLSAASSLLETPSYTLFKIGSVLLDILVLWELDRCVGSNTDGCLSS